MVVRLLFLFILAAGAFLPALKQVLQLLAEAAALAAALPQQTGDIPDPLELVRQPRELLLRTALAAV